MQKVSVAQQSCHISSFFLIHLMISTLSLARWAKRCACGVTVTDSPFNPCVPTKDELEFRTSTAESYVKHKLLGEGSFGTVHLARHRQSGMVCAIKVLLRKDCVLDMDANSYREVLVHRQVARTDTLPSPESPLCTR